MSTAVDLDPVAPIAGARAVVTGATGAFGRAIATALHASGAEVVALARNADALNGLRIELRDRRAETIAADAADPSVARAIVERYRPTILVLAAGARPVMQPLHAFTWETFSRHWDVDVQHVFHWVREALRVPLAPGSTVIAFSSGAAHVGSPLSGGYAGAKATIRFVAAYAAEESRRAQLGIRFFSVLPAISPHTEIGAAAAAAYAERRSANADDRGYDRLENGKTLEPPEVAARVQELLASGDRPPGSYLIGPGTIAPTPRP